MQTDTTGERVEALIHADSLRVSGTVNLYFCYYRPSAPRNGKNNRPLLSYFFYFFLFIIWY
jgi:hypothetical protein